MNGYGSNRRSSGARDVPGEPRDDEDRHVGDEPPRADEPGDRARDRLPKRLGVDGGLQRPARLERLVEAAADRALTRHRGTSVGPVRRRRSLLAPVVGQHVVDDVVDGDGAEQVAVLVDDGQRDQVVRREVAGDLLQRRLRAERLELVVDDAGHQRRRRLAQQPLEVGDAEVAAGRRLQRRAADVDLRGQRRGRGRGCGRGPAPRRRWRRGAGSPARSSSCRRRCAPRRRAGGGRRRPRRAPSGRAARCGLVGRELAEQVGGVVGPIASRTSAARSCSSMPRISTWSSSGSSSRTSASRSSSSAAATSARRLGDSSCSTVREVGGAQLLEGREQVAPRPGRPRSRVKPVTASQSTMNVCAAAAQAAGRGSADEHLGDQPVAGARCSIATSRTVTRRSPASRSVTLRSSISPSTRVSVGRCSKRRRLTRPVVMTCPASIAVTRVIGTKIRRRGLDLDDEPEHARRLGADAQGHDDVADPPDLVAVGVEDGDPGQARDEDPSSRRSWASGYRGAGVRQVVSAPRWTRSSAPVGRSEEPAAGVLDVRSRSGVGRRPARRTGGSLACAVIWLLLPP